MKATHKQPEGHTAVCRREGGGGGTEEEGTGTAILPTGTGASAWQGQTTQEEEDINTV